MATQTFTTTSSWVCPGGVNSVTVECWGGGGAGGVASGTASGAGGGAGGQYAIKVVSVTAGTSYTVTVATAAVAVTTGGVVTNGSDSWFSTTGTVIAKGGAGGADATGATGAGGTGSTTGGIGDTVFAGGSGATGVSSTQSGGGGGGAGSTGTGNSGSGATAGAAKANNGGAGGNGVSTANTQNNGSNYGGGGSGGLSSSATNRKGGDGAPGLVVLTFEVNPAIIGLPYVAPKTTFPFGAKKFNTAPYIQCPLPPQIPAASATPGVYVDASPCGTIENWTLVYPSQAEVIRTTNGPLAIDGWQLPLMRPAFPAVRPRTDFTVLNSPVTAAAETVTLDKWRQADPVPIYSRARAPQIFSVLAPSEDVTAIYKWLAETIRPVLLPKRIPVDFTTFARVPTAETITIDKWLSPAREPVFRPKRVPLDFTVFNRAPVVAGETITLDKWKFYATPILKIKQLLRVDWATKDLIPRAETVLLDKWFQPSPVQLPRLRLLPVNWTVADPKPTALFPLSWYQPLAPRLTRQRMLSQNWTIADPKPSVLIPLSWYQPSPVPRRLLNRLQYLYPQLAIDAAFFLVPSGLTDYLSPNKNVANGILFTSHVGVGVLTVSNVGTGSLMTGDVDAGTITVSQIGTSSLITGDVDVSVLLTADIGTEP